MEVVVASGLDAPAAARAAVAAWLSPQVADQVLGDAQLLVSELVTNSVRHAQLAAGATVRVSVEICDGFVRLEVEDPGDVAIGAVAPDREHGGGFGRFRHTERRGRVVDVERRAFDASVGDRPSRRQAGSTRTCTRRRYARNK